MQLSNDFHYLANCLATCEPERHWSARSSIADRFKAASKLVYDACLEEQVATNSAIIHSADFSCSNDASLAGASTSVNEVVSQINAFAAAISVSQLHQY